MCKIGSRKSARLNRVGALSHFRTFKGSHFDPLLLSDFQTFTFYHVTTFILLPSHMTTISQFTGTLNLCCFQKNWPYCAGLDWTQFVLCCARLRCVGAFSCNDSVHGVMCRRYTAHRNTGLKAEWTKCRLQLEQTIKQKFS